MAALSRYATNALIERLDQILARGIPGNHVALGAHEPRCRNTSVLGGPEVLCSQIINKLAVAPTVYHLLESQRPKNVEYRTGRQVPNNKTHAFRFWLERVSSVQGMSNTKLPGPNHCKSLGEWHKHVRGRCCTRQDQSRAISD